MVTQLPRRHKGTAPPQFSAHVRCGQTAWWIKVGLNPGTPSCPFPKGSHWGHSSPPQFSAHLLWPNSWMDQDAIWYGGRPQTRPQSVRWGPSFPHKRNPQFSAHVYCGHGHPSQLLLSCCNDFPSKIHNLTLKDAQVNFNDTQFVYYMLN